MSKPIPVSPNDKISLVHGAVFFLLSYVLVQMTFYFRSANNLSVFFGNTFYENKLLYQTLYESLSFSTFADTFLSYLSFQSLFFNPLHFLFSNEIFLGVLFGLTCTFAWYILRVKKQTPGRVVFTLLFCLFSPSLLMQFISFSPFIFTIPLMLLLFFVLDKGLRKISVFLFLFLSFFSFESALIAYALVWYYAKNRRTNFLLILQSVVALGILVTHLAYSPMTFSFAFPFFETKLIIGYPLYLFCIGFIGFLLTWTKRKKVIHLTSLCVLILSFFQESFIPFATIMLAFYGSICMEKLFQMDWKESFFKIASLLLIYGLIVSSFIFFIQAALLLSPSFAESQFYEEVSQTITLGEVESTILTLPRHQSFLSYFTNATTVTTLNSSFYYITDLRASLTLLKEQNVQYVLVDETMRNGEIWSLETEGLLLLLTDEDAFKIVTTTEYGTLYWVNYRSLIQ